MMCYRTIPIPIRFILPDRHESNKSSSRATYYVDLFDIVAYKVTISITLPEKVQFQSHMNLHVTVGSIPTAYIALPVKFKFQSHVNLLVIVAY